MSTMPQLVDAKLTFENRIAILTLNRDDVRNILTGTHLVDDIVNTVAWVNQTPQVSVLIIIGEGRAFSAGGNIKDMRDRKETFGGDVATVQKNYREGIQRIPLAIDSLEVPVIAAINGAAIGAGFDLACMCDLRIAAKNAKMGETFINLGIVPGDGGAWFLQRIVGYQRAAELTFSGRVIDADEAQILGIVLEVVESEDLLAAAIKYAKNYAEKPPQALRYTKRLIKLAQDAGQSGQENNLSDFLDECGFLQGLCHNTHDHLEAVNAFIEKRQAEFKGE